MEVHFGVGIISGAVQYYKGVFLANREWFLHAFSFGFGIHFYHQIIGPLTKTLYSTLYISGEVSCTIADPEP